MTFKVSGLTAYKRTGTTMRPVLQDLTVEFKPGELTLVVGPIGAGKSTLVECLAGICRPTAGSITLNGASLWHGARVNADVLYRIGVVWQSPEEQLFATTALGEFRYTLKPLRLTRDSVRQRVHTSLESVGLTESILPENPFLFSGGTQRRLVLATTIAANPDWLIADEPSAGLDTTSSKQVTTWFREFATRGRGVIIVTHDLDDWLPVADNILFLQAGRLVKTAAPAELMKSGAWPVDVVAVPTAIRLMQAIGDHMAPQQPMMEDENCSPEAIAKALIQARSAAHSSPAQASMPTEQTAPHPASVDHDAGSDGTLPHRGHFADSLEPTAKWICYLLLSFGVVVGQGLLGVVLGIAGTTAAWVVCDVPPGPIWKSARPIVMLYAVSALFAGIQWRRIPGSFAWSLAVRRHLTVGFSPTAAATVLAHVTPMLLVVILATLFSLSSTTLELKRGLSQALRLFQRWRLPVELLSLCAALVLRLIPLLQTEATRFANIARSRGKSTSKTGLRLRDIPAIVIPLTLSVLRYGESLSTALEARGYQVSGRVPDDRSVWSRRDLVAVTSSCLCFAGLIATRFITIHW